jgi:glyoxylase-like metal-dependent hydrolase (beta-lactamase superfamily II)
MATRVHELLPGIFFWSWLSERHGYDFQGTFVLSDGGNLCIDPVAPSAAVLARLEREGVARVLLTNRNHTRAANLVRERTRARVAIHPADAAHARKEGTPIDDDLQVGERVGPFTVVGVPGKSPGETALHDPQRRLLIVGDAVIGNPPGRLSLLRESVMDDPPRLRASVRRLRELDFDALLTGDGVPIPTGARERLAELVATFPND